MSKSKKAVTTATETTDALDALFGVGTETVATDTIEGDTETTTLFAAGGEGDEGTETVVTGAADEDPFAGIASIIDGLSDEVTGAVVTAIEAVEASATPPSSEAVEASEMVAVETAKKVRAPIDRSKFLAVAGIESGDAWAERIGALAKKVREKCENVADAIAGGRRVSNFTRDTLKFAMANDNTFTMKALVEAFENGTFGGKYSPGTARAQAQQMGALFVALGVATKTDKTYNLVDGDLLAALKSASSPQAVAA